MWRLIPAIFSCLLLAAHFSRADLLPLSIICIVIAFLPFYKTAWMPRFMQLFLVLGAIEWIRTLLVFTNQRIDAGQPWTRLAIILGSVALLTLISAFIFKNKTLAEKYKN